MGLLSPFARAWRDARADLALASGGTSGPFTFLAYLFHPGFQVCLSYRLARLCRDCRLTPLARATTALGRLCTGCDIHYRAEIAGGVLFPHGRGVVIGEGVTVETRCSLFHNVTVGGEERRPGFPHLEEGVNLYPGTVISGPVRVGEYCRVGPNVYLTESVPSHTRVRPPEPVVRRKSDV